MSATIESESTRTSFWRAALLVAGCVLLGGMVLAPFAMGKTGSSGLAGVALAGAICLAAGWLTEGVAYLLGRSASPLATMLLGMTIRMLPPLLICLLLAAQGARGREHLPFIVYLLSFYLLTLGAETWLTLKRLTPKQVSQQVASTSAAVRPSVC